MIFIIVRWPPPISLLALMIDTVPSPLNWTWPVAGSPPAPWLHAWAARPMPWKTPGRTSLAFGACQFCVQPILSAAMLDAVDDARVAQRQLGVRVAVDVDVLQAELDRVHVDGVGRLLDRRLERERAVGMRDAAIGAREYGW